MAFNYGSKLGEAVGKAVEKEIVSIVRAKAVELGYSIRAEYTRTGEKIPKRFKWVNETGNAYQIDCVVVDNDDNPIVLLESKFLRYTKHNRDKGSWTCVAHYKLRTSLPTVRKSIAVLLGNWTESSKKLMNSCGIDLVEVPFQIMVQVLAKHGIKFDWEERDNETPKNSWELFSALDEAEQEEIAKEILSCVKAEIEEEIRTAITEKMTQPRNIVKVEVLIESDRGEYIVKKFSRATDTITFLLELIQDKPTLPDDYGRK
jgi:ribulose bisphosphate carboxylase small subunit